MPACDPGILAAVLLSALPSAARSQTIEITPMAGYRFGGTLYSFKATNLETPGLFTSTPVMDLTLDTWQGGGNYLFGTKDARVVPFIGFGLGLTRLLPKAQGLSDETRFSASFAGGARFWLGKHVGIRVEGRNFLTVFDRNSDRPGGSGPGCGGHTDRRDLSQGEGRSGLILRF